MAESEKKMKMWREQRIGGIGKESWRNAMCHFNANYGFSDKVLKCSSQNNTILRNFRHKIPIKYWYCGEENFFVQLFSLGLRFTFSIRRKFKVFRIPCIKFGRMIEVGKKVSFAKLLLVTKPEKLWFGLRKNDFFSNFLIRNSITNPMIQEASPLYDNFSSAGSWNLKNWKNYSNEEKLI